MNAKEQLQVISRGTLHLMPEDALLSKLERSIKESRPLNIKYGADPSAPDLHLGHAVCFKKLKEFQDLGHQVIFVIGDFTAMIGDPTGRSETRKPLTREQVRDNAATYMEQVYLLLDKDKTKVVYNHAWLSELNLSDVIKLSSKFTVARMLERDDFSKRHKSQTSIGVHEFLYPVMVSYDSVHLKADVEAGGNDQLFNFLAGRELMQELGMEPQVALTMPILVGTDGVNKMSKSLGNYIAIKDSPKEMFGKTMSIPDSAILTYAQLAAFYRDDQISKIKELLNAQENPRNIKAQIARDIAAIYHGAAKAAAASAEFDQMFRNGGLPENLPEHDPGADKVWIVKLITGAGCAKNSSEARRLIEQGGVHLDGEKITSVDAEVEIKDGAILKVGKRNFVKMKR
jgi:tyrosyl-tRNA synthetase